LSWNNFHVAEDVVSVSLITSGIVSFTTSHVAEAQNSARQEICSHVFVDLQCWRSTKRIEWRDRMPVTEGFFVDWDGNASNTLDPGGGYLCETDPVARYVAITTKGGTLVHEGTFYKSLGAIEKAGITAPLVPGSHP
jgi:hypothetical protein